MKANFERCLAETLAHEGGWSDHPSDPGGATMRGITIGTYAQFKGRKVTKAELRAIGDDEVRTIYRRNYWDKVRGDDLPPGFDLVAFDSAVNSGPARAARWLQAALGVAADGRIGPQTVAAARLAAAEGEAGDAIVRACTARLAFLRGLKTWPAFGKGWSRRVSAVQAAALRMATEAASAPVAPVAQPPQVRQAETQEGLWAALWRALRGIVRRTE